MLQAVKGFQVDQSDKSPTHNPVGLAIATKSLAVKTRNLRKTESASEATIMRIEEITKDVGGNVEVDHELHARTDEHVEARQQRMTYSTADRDSNRLWDLIIACAEGATGD